MDLFTRRQQTGATPPHCRAVSHEHGHRWKGRPEISSGETQVLSFPVSPGLHPTPATVTRVL